MFLINPFFVIPTLSAYENLMFSLFWISHIYSLKKPKTQFEQNNILKKVNVKTCSLNQFFSQKSKSIFSILKQLKKEDISFSIM